MKTHRSLYQISRKSTPKCRHIIIRIPSQCENTPRLGSFHYKMDMTFDKIPWVHSRGLQYGTREYHDKHIVVDIVHFATNIYMATLDVKVAEFVAL